MDVADLRPYHRLTALATCALTVVALVPAVRAQSATPSLAETLFLDGRHLMAEKKYAEACPKFAESQRLDPATGTLLNLAACHAEEGKLASAWVEFNDALDAARRDGRADRVKFARDHLARIRLRVSHITLVVPEAARAPGLTVKLDGTAIGAAGWGLSTPVDPGSHEVLASADGRRTWTNNVVVGADADNQVVQIPVLGAEAPVAEDMTVPPVEREPEKVPSPPPPLPTPGTPPPSPLQTHEGSSSSSHLRTVSYVVGGAGIVGLGVGTIFGLRAFSKWSSHKSHCPGSDTNCDMTGVADGNAASTAATVSDIGIGFGLAAVATGAILWFRSRPDDAGTGASSTASIAPAVGTGSGGLVLSGVW